MKKIGLFFITILLSSATLGQSGNLVEPNAITSKHHLSQVGKIRFLASPISVDDTKDGDFLAAIELNKSSNLYLRAYLDNSLTNYLHRLAPDATALELNQSGNFQFRFYVDERLIYSENLHPGAFGEQNKNKATVFRVPLTTVKTEDSWGKFLWGRFMARGGDEALSNGAHKLHIEIRPYVLKPTEKSGDIIAQGDITVNFVEESIAADKLTPATIAQGSQWTLNKAPYSSEKIKELKGAILREKFKQITSIVVIKNGQLALEEYFNGASRETLHDTRSVSKTITSALTGIAIANHHIKDSNQTLGDFYDLRRYDNFSTKKQQITLHHLLTMSSAFDGFDFDESSKGNEENMYPQADWVKWTLGLPLANRDSGSQWSYFTAGVVVLGDILDKHVPGGLEKFAATKLFEPLGIKHYQWQYTPQKVANTAGGLQMRSLDLARFGQLYLDQGKWQGTQIIPQAWVAESLKQQVDVPIDNMHYGLLFWNQKFHVGDKKYASFYCSGNGGNKVHIVKELGLVIVITAKAYNTPTMHQQADKIMEKYLLPAFL